jgi:hypothetical protein
MWQDLYEFYVFLFGILVGNSLGVYGQVDLWWQWKQHGWPFTWHQVNKVQEWVKNHWNMELTSWYHTSQVKN